MSETPSSDPAFARSIDLVMPYGGPEAMAHWAGFWDDAPVDMARVARVWLERGLSLVAIAPSEMRALTRAIGVVDAAELEAVLRAEPEARIAVATGYEHGCFVVRYATPEAFDLAMDGEDPPGPIWRYPDGSEARMYLWSSWCDGLVESGPWPEAEGVSIAAGRGAVPIPPSRLVMNGVSGRVSTLRAQLPELAPPSLFERLATGRFVARERRLSAAAVMVADAPDEAVEAERAERRDLDRKYAAGVLRGEIDRLKPGVDFAARLAAAGRLLGAYVGAGLLDREAVEKRLTLRAVAFSLGRAETVRSLVSAAVESGLSDRAKLPTAKRAGGRS